MSIRSLFSGKTPPDLEEFNEGPEYFDKFHKESNHRKLEMISSHVGLRQILDKLLSIPESFGKAEEYAETLIDWASSEFTDENYVESFKRYCDAVHYATGKSVLHALEGRSSVLINLGLYQECITDIKMAFRLECPSEIKFVLYKRLGLCLTNLKQYREALEAFRNADAMLQKMSGVSIEAKREMRQLILSSLSNAVTVAKLSASKVAEKTDDLPPITYGQNPLFPCLSSAVEVRWSESKGKALVANRWIKRGDVLIVEPSFAVVSLKPKASAEENDTAMTRCPECIDAIVSPIPCTQCIYVSYCSETCRKIAWEKFHRFECGHSEVLGYLDWAGRLALKMMLSIGETLVAQVAVDVGCYDELSNDWGSDEGDDLNDRLKKRSEQEDCYRRIYGMVSHLGKENAWNNFKFHWMAYFISNFLLRKTEFFASLLPRDQYDTPKAKLVELAVAFRALLHLSQVVVNAMTVQDMWSNPCLLSSIGWGVNRGHIDPEEYSYSALGWNVPVAHAICLSTSTVNHSCYPNAKCSWYKKFVILKATREIQPGEEVVISYLGHDYREKEKSARAQYLTKNYFFDCECAACSNPSLYTEEYFKAHRCLDCEGPMLRKDNEIISSEVCNKHPTTEAPIIRSNFHESKKEKKKNKYKLKKVPQKCNLVDEQNYVERYLICQNCKALRRESEYVHKICQGATFLSQGNMALRSMSFHAALSALGECLKVYRNCLYKNHMRFVQILDMMGRAHASKGDYLSAIECIIQSLPILEKLDYGNMLYAFQLQKLGELIIHCLIQMERSTVFRLKYKRARECLTSAKEIYMLNGGKWFWVMNELDKQEEVLDVIGHWLKKDNGLSLQDTIEHHFPKDKQYTRRFNYFFLNLDYWFSESLIS